MTPFKELGYKETDEFRVIADDVDNCGFTTDDTILLYEDDETDFPEFCMKDQEHIRRFVQLKNIVKKYV